MQCLGNAAEMCGGGSRNARGVGKTVVLGRKLLLTIVIYPYQGGV